MTGDKDYVFTIIISTGQSGVSAVVHGPDFHSTSRGHRIGAQCILGAAEAGPARETTTTFSAGRQIQEDYNVFRGINDPLSPSSIRLHN